MDVSIVILSYFHPEITDVCLRTLQITEGVEYEVIVVDNGSDRKTTDALREHKDQGRIDKLILEERNHLFAGGNNIGVHAADPDTKFILLLNSDVAFLRPDWLSKAISWIEGTAKYWPSIWGQKPTVVEPGPLSVVSLGWSHDVNIVPSKARPEGFCCLIRKSEWTDISTDFPWHYGLEEMIAKLMRRGGRCGVLSQYGSYLVHREGGSGDGPKAMHNKRQPDLAGWFYGLKVETLDFTLGPDEHSSYLWW